MEEFNYWKFGVGVIFLLVVCFAALTGCWDKEIESIKHRVFNTVSTGAKIK